MTRYDPRPRYPLSGGSIDRGYGPLAAAIGERQPSVLAIDGPSTLDWNRLAVGLESALDRIGHPVRIVHTRDFLADATAIERRTVDGPLRDDPVFARLFDGRLDELFARRPMAERPDQGTAMLIGPGAGLADHDLLWLADHPRRVSADAVKRGIAAPVGMTPGQSDAGRRLVFVDWPMLDRHHRSQLSAVDRFIDAAEPEAPRSVTGEVLRKSLRELAAAPFRTLPTFAPGPWGGQWMRETLGIDAGDAPNLAWSYELIAPESSVLLGDEPALEVGFEMVLEAAGPALLGAEAYARFEGSFPIRFDYLDTVGGGNLSVHCHPQERYMRDVFGWRYTQHESYYVMATEPGAHIFLGLRDDVDADAFAADAARSQHAGEPLRIERFVQTHEARLHGLYLIPAGTPHASSAGNVVLEISATPYLYSLRFYDWLREDLDGELRPVQLDHAFANLDARRAGDHVREQLIPEPREVRRAPGFVELELGRHPDLFFAVHRLDFEGQVRDETLEGFHVLNVVEGQAVEIESGAGRRHRLSYGETILVPASVGTYSLRSTGRGPCRVVKAFVA
ncbi:MAG TPA: class I mannose-6-phosphate isomerase [Candidatus Limnocylindrales bacterium]|nr:class I mannose-6-phosphate isomerase [Candidatus Limnocylindrales bacterium]